ncbi:hypothetical protein JI739_04505 [Ramlibacter sp. AW1]|uniref:Uncharacterized protein n=1 Tax=Ramlibacter aurantiacus TaxID=2801330 RepID=A0A936ZNQ3_9BURK|nr:hypothetical protein [Ramlibacter aurantiacus]MBL0419606.1 hypothetical protein [Ramlibacter aurantiacus]
MAHDPDKPTTEFLSLPRFSGDRATVPTPIELDSATAWAEFQRLSGQSVDDPAPDSPAPGFAPTVPDTLSSPTAAAPPAAAPPRLTVQDVMVEARRFNRVCPKPADWQRLHQLLPVDRSGRPAPAPVSGGAWQATGAMPKRMRLRDQVEWAEAHGELNAVMDFLKSLSEAQWHHMDE